MNALTGEKYHSNAQTYYRQIRAVSDRLCQEHGLSIFVQGKTSKAMSYYECLRQSKGQPTFRFRLEADLIEATDFICETNSQISALTKQRTILHVRKKRHQVLYSALADVEDLAPVIKGTGHVP